MHGYCDRHGHHTPDDHLSRQPHCEHSAGTMFRRGELRTDRNGQLPNADCRILSRVGFEFSERRDYCDCNSNRWCWEYSILLIHGHS